MEINEIRFPSNSHLKPVPEIEPKRREVKQIATPVKTRKASLAKRAQETFLAEDIRDVKTHIFREVVVPGIIDFVLDFFHSGIDMVFGVGGRRGGRYSSRRSGKQYTNYSSISYKGNDEPRYRQVRSDGRFNLEEIIVGTRGEAEEIIHNLADLCEDYGCARVADLYSMVGISGEFTAERWGWETVASARAVRDHRSGGYLIDMPRPIYLE